MIDVFLSVTHWLISQPDNHGSPIGESLHVIELSRERGDASRMYGRVDAPLCILRTKEQKRKPWGSPILTGLLGGLAYWAATKGEKATGSRQRIVRVIVNVGTARCGGGRR